MNPGQERRGGRGGGSNPAAAASQTKPISNLTVIIPHQSYLKITLMYGHESSHTIVGLHPPEIAFGFLGSGKSRRKQNFLRSWPEGLSPVAEQARQSRQLSNPTQPCDNKAYEMSTRCSEHALINAFGE